MLPVPSYLPSDLVNLDIVRSNSALSLLLRGKDHIAGDKIIEALGPKIRFGLEIIKIEFSAPFYYLHGGSLYRDSHDLDFQIDVEKERSFDLDYLRSRMVFLFPLIDPEKIIIKEIRGSKGSISLKIDKLEITICSPFYHNTSNYISYFDSVRLREDGQFEFKESYAKSYFEIYKERPLNANIYPRHETKYREVFNVNALEFFLRAYYQLYNNYHLQDSDKARFISVLGLQIKNEFLRSGKYDAKIMQEKLISFLALHGIENPSGSYVKDFMDLVEEAMPRITVLTRNLEKSSSLTPDSQSSKESSEDAPAGAGFGAGAGVVDDSSEVDSLDSRAWMEDGQFPKLFRSARRHDVLYIPAAVSLIDLEFSAALDSFIRSPVKRKAVAIIHSEAHYMGIYFKKESSGQYFVAIFDPLGCGFDGKSIHKIPDHINKSLIEKNLGANLVFSNTRLQTYRNLGEHDFVVDNDFCGAFVDSIMSGMLDEVVRVNLRSKKIQIALTKKWLDIKDLDRKESLSLGRSISSDDNYLRALSLYIAIPTPDVDIRKPSVFEAIKRVAEPTTVLPTYTKFKPKADEINVEDFYKLLQYEVSVDEKGELLPQVMFIRDSNLREEIDDFILSKKDIAIIGIVHRNCAAGIYLSKKDGIAVYFEPFGLQDNKSKVAKGVFKSAPRIPIHDIPKDIFDIFGEKFAHLSIVYTDSKMQNYKSGKFIESHNLAFVVMLPNFQQKS